MKLHHLLVAVLLSLTSSTRAGDAVVTVRAEKKLFTLSAMMIGANMEDLHYQMVGGIDSQMLHGASFFEHSPTELAPRKEQLDGFATVNGLWAASNGVVTVTVRPGDGTPWLEAGLTGGQPPVMLENNKPAKDAGARMTSLDTAPSDTVETRVSFCFATGDDLPASLIPNHSDNGWNWYAGYTVELDPKAQKVRLLASHRASKHQELGSAPVQIPSNLWLPVVLRLDGQRLSGA